MNYDDLIKKARDAEVQDHQVLAAREAFVYPPSSARGSSSRLVVLLPFALGLAAAAVLFGISNRPQTTAPQSPKIVQIGARVQMLAQSTALWHLSQSDASNTILFLKEGEITLRLAPGHAHHTLRVETPQGYAEAIGTVFNVTGGQEFAVETLEGSVVVVDSQQNKFTIVAGQRYENGEQGSSATLQQAQVEQFFSTPLRKVPAPKEQETPGDRPNPSPAPSPSEREKISAKPKEAEAPLKISSPKQALEEAEVLLENQDFDAGIAKLRAVAKVNDPTWSPIALLTLIEHFIRIQSGEEIIATLANDYFTRFPKHPLRGSTKDKLCQGLAAASITVCGARD